MQNIVKASGKNYFPAPEFPVAVKVIAPDAAYQHEHDLTTVLHCHDFVELVLVTSGEAVQIINEERIPVCCGEVFVVQGLAGHCFVESKHLGLINIQYDLTHLDLPLSQLRKIPGYNVVFDLEPSFSGDKLFRHRLKLKPDALSEVQNIALRLECELAQKNHGFECAGIALLLELIVRISRQYEPQPDTKQPSLLRMAKVISAMENQCQKKWTLADFCKIAATSPNNLLRLFKTATGVTPMDYLNHVRLRRAVSLLITGTRSISEIAVECGFGDSNYFARRFAEVHKKSPGNYRRQFRG